MSTILLYRRFGIFGYNFVKQDFIKDLTFFRIEQPRERFRCPLCNSSDVWAQGGEVRTIQSLPIGSKPTFVTLKVPRVYCHACKCTRQCKINFADPKKSYTHAFERYVLEVSRLTTIQDAANHLRLSWDTVKDIQAKYLQRKFSKPKLGKLKQIAIDEICIGKGQRYLTVVLNLITGAVVFVGDGKGGDALKPFWKRLRRSHAKIEAVATDMSKAYIKAVRDNLKGSVHVFDHFHVIKLFNEKLSDLRRSLYLTLTAQGKKLVKGIRWLLLQNEEDLDAKGKNRLDRALKLNEPLAIAYYLKEDLRQLWRQPNKQLARLALRAWLLEARESGVKMLEKFADTLEEYQEGILNYYDYRISTGPLEGTNNKIRKMNGQAYGYRDLAFFKLKILALHTTKYALIG